MTHKSISISDYTPSIDALKNKIIMLTGACDELGHSLSVELAKHGATIILLDKSVKKLEQIYDEIEKNGGPQPAIMPLDIENAEEHHYQTLAKAIAEHFSQLDGLILNATILGQHGPIIHTDLKQWERALKVNLTSNFLFLKHCSAVLNAAERASCVYLNHEATQRGRAYWGTLTSPKAACLNLIDTLVDEWETNTEIHLNSLDPGPINTTLRRQALPGEDPSQHPLPKTVAKALLYFMDPGITWPNGKHYLWTSADAMLTEN